MFADDSGPEKHITGTSAVATRKGNGNRFEGIDISSTTGIGAGHTNT
jgi:hypothetical protein